MTAHNDYPTWPKLSLSVALPTSYFACVKRYGKVRAPAPPTLVGQPAGPQFHRAHRA